jgi:hypothetical protein
LDQSPEVGEKKKSFLQSLWTFVSNSEVLHPNVRSVLIEDGLSITELEMKALPHRDGQLCGADFVYPERISAVWDLDPMGKGTFTGFLESIDVMQRTASIGSGGFDHQNPLPAQARKQMFSVFHQDPAIPIARRLFTSPPIGRLPIHSHL